MVMLVAIESRLILQKSLKLNEQIIFTGDSVNVDLTAYVLFRRLQSRGLKAQNNLAHDFNQ